MRPFDPHTFNECQIERESSIIFSLGLAKNQCKVPKTKVSVKVLFTYSLRKALVNLGSILKALHKNLKILFELYKYTLCPFIIKVCVKVFSELKRNADTYLLTYI